MEGLEEGDADEFGGKSAGAHSRRKKAIKTARCLEDIGGWWMLRENLLYIPTYIIPSKIDWFDCQSVDMEINVYGRRKGKAIEWAAD
jgi:hypothetical protein